MLSRFPKISYSNLSARQKENYNFQKVSGLLAEHGFATIRLSDDWNGADFIAQHLSGETLKVQLKGRLTFCSKYQNRDLWMTFPHGNGWYLYPHDVLLAQVNEINLFTTSQSWLAAGEYSWPSIPGKLLTALQQYFLKSTDVG
jgi:hypothetical protein